jgi:hypothetical protein
LAAPTVRFAPLLAIARTRLRTAIAFPAFARTALAPFAGFLTCKIRVAIGRRRFARPRRQHFQVEQIDGVRRH